MKKRKIGMALSMVLTAGTLLGACGKADDNGGEKGGEKKDNFSVAMVTDVGGVDDKSFNQSAWEGLQNFGKENGLEKGKGGYDYIQSKSDADYATNLNTLVRQDFDLVYGIGFLMQAAVEEIAQQQKDAHFAIVDAEVQQPNVASILFKEQEAAFLAGVAAALTTKTNHIGFIGGMEIPVIERFESGFLAGVKAAKPEVQVDVQYAGAFDKAEVGQSIASKMYSSGADVIFHAAGATGNGLFKEASDRKAKAPDKDFWAIGVDRDQADMGPEIVLTSALKRVDVAVQDLATKAKDGNFPGGEIVLYGLQEDGVGLAPINDKVANKADIESAVKDWIEKIKSGDVKVPGTREELKSFSVK
ncbi:BMP family lipoprotein [Neobacillus thermocopriae]|uniref:BMP family ABC transporter substrate-binding protein n=1 Tax=Neobacillus thermocopriae TaxID=1215031 RepID=A0A6B3TLF7_9BACI|nr:BMP family protein [Neobacillus thermocopriae]MED3624202.1 BMP family protein [Neobacillus thermocopriae]MED3713603.1 BMP family protein [Neobacillus thermocopriae]NEX77713.1 BMP family ABC transporter substrate-binding protein [Neobacillus thermocopriae]